MILNGKLLIEILPLRDLYTEYREHRRLKVFVHKGRKCVTCERVGTLLLVTLQENGANSSRHVDLYTDDFVLMTVDHETPRYQAKLLGWSKEVTESLYNKQPMCEPCNNSKGSKLLSNEELRERRKHVKITFKGVEIIRQLVHNNNIFDKNLQGVQL